MKIKSSNIPLTLIIFTMYCLINIANAGLIDAGSYSNDNSNNIYWTNNDLGLDIMRLSYSDLLNVDGTSSGGQADKGTIDTWLASQSEWRWATDNEFVSHYLWFETDLISDTWSTDQFIGSRLFFDLNGTGPDYASNAGYTFNGSSYWNIISDTILVSSLIVGRNAKIQIEDASFGTTILNRGHHNKFFTNNVATLGFVDLTTSHNTAPLIVRNITHVPEPSTLAIFALGIIGLASSRFKKKS